MMSGAPLPRLDCSPKKSNRWAVLFASLIGIACSYATIGVGAFTLLVGPLSDEFGWSREQVSLGLTVFTLNFVLFASPIGIMMDRFGVRRILLCSNFLFGIGIGSMFFLQSSLWHFYGMYMLLGLFSLGTLPGGYTRIVLNWFPERSGLPLSIALSGVGVAGMIVLPTVIHIVEFFGWREAYLFMSFLILFVSLPAVAFLLVEQPRHQTETRVQKAGKSSNPGRQIKGLNLNGTLKTSCFWKILFTFFCLGLASIGVVSHLVPMLTIRGILASEIAVLFSVGGAALIFGRVLCGYMLDHYHAPVVTSLFISALAIASWMLADGYQGFTLMLIIVVLINISIGAEFDLIAYLTSRYFGIKSYGSIYGLIFSGFYAGAGIGSWFLGRVFDNSGSYIFGLWVLSGVLILAILSVIRLGPYSFFNVEKQNV